MGKASKASARTGKTQNISVPHPAETRNKWDTYINVFVFLIFVVVLGLLNIDVLVLDALKDREAINLADFVSDGGLLFYSMTLLGGSVYTVLSSPHRRHMDPYDKLVFCVCFAVGIIVAALASSNYTEYMAHNKQYTAPPNFFPIQLWIAIFSTVVALIITFMVERLAPPSPQTGADNKIRMPNP